VSNRGLAARWRRVFGGLVLLGLTCAPAAAQSQILLEKATNGQDADSPPGPVLTVGDPVAWTYQVTNTGSRDITNLAVTDDQGVVVTCPGTMLAPGASMVCTGNGTAQEGQYANVGTVSAELPDGTAVEDSDPSHYFGQALAAVDLEKATNGVDADTAPGPSLPVGAAVTWTYTVTNVGSETLSDIAVTDDQGVVVTCPGTTLPAGEFFVCTGNGTVQPGQYANLGTVTASLPDESTAGDSDPSHYFGQVLSLEKATNGEDADLPPGPSLFAGSAVNWTYEVTNPGPGTVTGLAVTDDQGVVVTCPGTTLAAGEAMTCTGNGTAQAGQYANVGTATGQLPGGETIAASDPSHYLGQDPGSDFGDAADPSYPTALASNGARHLLGSGVYLGACVDSELDGQPTAAATGDDAAAGLATFGTCAVAGDDEDGVAFTTPLIAGTTAGVDVTASQPCTLSAWIDFNADGDWSDPGDTLFPGGTALAAGASSLSLAVPPGAVLGVTAARFRCTTDGAVGFTGEATDGEVEDHAVTIVAAAEATGIPTLSEWAMLLFLLLLGRLGVRRLLIETR